MLKKSVVFKTCLGNIRIEFDEEYVFSINFVNEAVDSANSNELSLRAMTQIEEYLTGKRKNFNLPLYIDGTIFQQHVWQAVQEIPYGARLSYKDIAKKLGKPTAYRAVGNANNKNKFLIVIPCHRVVGQNGNLIGYAGGIAKKQQLLELEEKYR